MDALGERLGCGGGQKASSREAEPAVFRSVCGKCGAVRVDQQIGLEETPAAYVARLVEVFREVRRALHPSGVCFVNIGDSYANDVKGPNGTPGPGLEGAANQRGVPKPWRGGTLKKKDLVGIPWRLAFGLQDDGWYLRSPITLCKLSPMPESVTDRPTNATEMLFMLTKRPNYFYDRMADRRLAAESSVERLLQNLAAQAGSDRANGGAKTNGTMKAVGDVEAGANLWNYWAFRSAGFDGAHFACFHEDLPGRCVRLGSSKRGVCPECFAPWRRMTAKKRRPTRPGRNTKVTARAAAGTGGSGEYTGDGRAQFRSNGEVGNRDPRRHCTEVQTLGWEPGCKCGREDVIPSLVLDPFAGSGTTLAVAVKLKRRALGIELNPEYAALCEKRLAEPLGTGGLFASETPVVTTLFPDPA